MNIDILKTTESLKDFHTFITDALSRNITIDEIVPHLEQEVIDAPISHFYVNPESANNPVLFYLDLLLYTCGNPIERRERSQLGNLTFSNGFLVSKDPDKTKKKLQDEDSIYCKKIADLGLPHFQYNYAMYRVSVAECDADLEEVFEWMKLSSENGHVLALYVLSLMHLIGLGTGKNKEIGFKLLKKSAEFSVLEAVLVLDKIFKEKIDAEDLAEILKTTINKGYTLHDSTFNSEWEAWIINVGTRGNEQNEFIKKMTNRLYRLPGHSYVVFDEIYSDTLIRLSNLNKELGNMREALKYAEESIKMTELANGYGSVNKVAIDYLIRLKNEIGEPIDLEYVQTFADSGISTGDSFKLNSVAHIQMLENKNKMLEEANKELQQKEQELEDLMAMFAHKFRSPLDSIMYNISHGHDSAIYARNAQTMQGLLNIFGLISTDQNVLIEKLAKDNLGKGNLTDILINVLDMLILHLLTESGAEKIHQHFLAYAKTQGKVSTDTNIADWCDEYFDLEDEIRISWQQSFASLITGSNSLEHRLKWIEERFFRLDIAGFDIEISFKRFGVTESFLTIIINEILTNLFKYYSSADNNPAYLSLDGTRDKQYTISCSNPSTRSERLEVKGSYKGHTFLSALARKTCSSFKAPELKDDFHLEFSIPSNLLI